MEVGWRAGGEQERTQGCLGIGINRGGLEVPATVTWSHWSARIGPGGEDLGKQVGRR